MKNINIIVLVYILLWLSCNPVTVEHTERSDYKFELMDSIKIGIPYKLQFLSKKLENEKFLCYSQVENKFYLIRANGEILSNFNNQGEGPEEYSHNILQAGIYKNKIYIQDNKNLIKFDIKNSKTWKNSYQNPFYIGTGGGIKNKLLFMNDSIWINPIPVTEVVLGSSRKTEVLDTISIIQIRKFDIELGISEIIDEIEYERGSINKSDEIYPNFNVIFDIDDSGNIWVIYQNEPSLYNYKINKSNKLLLFQHSQLDINYFKEPKGVSEKELDNPKNNRSSQLKENPEITLNRNILIQLSAINSQIYDIFYTENNTIFIMYRNGIPDKYFPEDDIWYYSDESKNFGAIIKEMKVIDSGISLPEHNSTKLNPYNTLYIGENKWLVLQDYEIEIDHQTAYIYELIKYN
ncbi:hypothetical protein [Pleomorphovibrio marinus]|uniref:hypothetical protein n=1 Tax=Pleomorphovibrio marinus TaxID=2164132 RepID=UPI000E0C14FB|nr:hypothetical protein [Pleomorphovibrio marinus]